jgi:drug/metabolite transporter (DMT)-like permease
MAAVPFVAPPRHWTPAELAVRKGVGMGLAIGGNLLISLGLNVQKYVHNARERRRAAERRAYTAMPLWWVGFGLTLCGELGNFAAYGFAEAALVTPLGAVAVVANAFIAALALREGLRSRDVCGCALVVAGSVVVASSTRMHGEMVDPDAFVRAVTAPPFLAYSAGLGLAIAAAAASARRYGRSHVACYVTLCSLIGSVTVMAAKGLSSFLNAWAYGGDSPFAQPLPYALLAAVLVTALLQTRCARARARAEGGPGPGGGGCGRAVGGGSRWARCAHFGVARAARAGAGAARADEPRASVWARALT